VFTHIDKFEKFRLDCETTEKGRKYVTPEGNVYESVTTAISMLPGAKDGLNQWRARIGEKEAIKIGNMAANQGTKLHKIVEDYLNNEECYVGIDEDPDLPPRKSLMPNISLLFNNIKIILNSHINNIYLQEANLWSDVYRLAGTVDCLAEFDGKLSIIDFKTSANRKKREWIESYFLQTSAYAYMVKELYGVDIEQVVIIITGLDKSLDVFYDEPLKYKNHKFFTDRFTCNIQDSSYAGYY
jgi:genome maintenance exonuclease 1